MSCVGNCAQSYLGTCFVYTLFVYMLLVLIIILQIKWIFLKGTQRLGHNCVKQKYTNIKKYYYKYYKYLKFINYCKYLCN